MSESDDYRRQILTYKDGSHAERIKTYKDGPRTERVNPCAARSLSIPFQA